MSELIKNSTGTQKLIGYVVEVDDSNQCAQTSLTLTDAHTNRHDVLHGGIAATLLDSAVGFTSSMYLDPVEKPPCLTISLTVNFVAAAFKGDTVTATGRISGGGRSILYGEGVLKDQNGKVIATASGVFKRVNQRPTPKADGA